jgi:hypothetical protein
MRVHGPPIQLSQPASAGQTSLISRISPLCVPAMIAGLLLFSSGVKGYFVNPVFWTKMVLIVVAGINMMIFEFTTMCRNGILIRNRRTARRSQEGYRSAVGFWSRFSVT